MTNTEVTTSYQELSRNLDTLIHQVDSIEQRLDTLMHRVDTLIPTRKRKREVKRGRKTLLWHAQQDKGNRKLTDLEWYTECKKRRVKPPRPQDADDLAKLQAIFDDLEPLDDFLKATARYTPPDEFPLMSFTLDSLLGGEGYVQNVWTN